MDVTNGNILWNINNNSTRELEDFIYANNKIYAFFSLGSGIIGDSTKLYEINPNNGVSIVKHSLYGRDRNGFNLGPRGMIFYKHSNGNEIIFSQSNSFMTL